MAASLTRPSPTATPRPAPTIIVTRIRFVTEVPAGAKVRRAFTQPRRVFAVEEAATPADLPAGKVWPEPTDTCVIVFVPAGALNDWASADAWLAAPDRPDAPPPVTLERGDLRVRWRPGRAVVQGPAGAGRD